MDIIGMHLEFKAMNGKNSALKVKSKENVVVLSRILMEQKEELDPNSVEVLCTVKSKLLDLIVIMMRHQNQ